MHYLRDVDIAERFGIHRVTVWKWAQNGTLPKPVHLGPQTVRWPAEAIDEWERARRTEAA